MKRWVFVAHDCTLVTTLGVKGYMAYKHDVLTLQTRQTLRLLTAQHRKLARYLERRIAVAVASPSPAIETASPALPRSPVSPSFPEATVPGFPGFTPAVPGSIQTTGSSTQHPVASRRSSGVAVGLAAGRGGVLSPGLGECLVSKC